MSSGKRTALMFGGIAVIILFFFGGFISLFWFEDWNVGSILFRIMVLPMVGFLIGVAMIIYASGGTSRRASLGLFASLQPAEPQKEKNYVHELPDICPNCEAAISSETVDWVGPLTARCPYCGSSLKMQKREI